MTRPDDAERALIETEATKVFTDAHAEEPAAIRARFDRLAEALASRLSPDGRHLLARLAAMYCLSAAIDQGRPVPEVELVLDEIETIGFTDLKEEALCRFSFARHCLDQGDRARGAAIVGALLPRIDSARGGADDAEWADLLQRMAPLVGMLRDGTPG